MPHAEWTSDSSSESDGSQKDPFSHPPTSDFVIPSPVSLSDAEDDASPSQYRKEMMREQSRGHSHDEEEEQEDEEEEEEEVEDPVLVKEKSVASMYSDVINIARQFTTILEDTRKKELMSRGSKKGARQSLAFDSPPSKQAKYRHEQFTPPRHAREQIKATQYDDDDDYERDSLTSSQTGATRIRLQERWRIIGTKEKATTTSDEFNEWLREHGRAEMAKAGQFEDLQPASTDVGGFKHVHVSHFNIFDVNNSGDLNWIVFCRDTLPPPIGGTVLSSELSSIVPIGFDANAMLLCR
jgi:hypothetical protein